MQLIVKNVSKKETFRIFAEPTDTNATLKAKIQNQEGSSVNLFSKLFSVSLNLFNIF